MSVTATKCVDPGKLRNFVPLLIGAMVSPVGHSLGQSPFWDSKEPQNYSESEKLQVMTSSPWAKVVQSGGKTPGPSASFGKFDSSTNGLERQPPRQHSAPSTLDTPAPKPDLKNPVVFYGPVTIRWETASPIRELTETALPEKFENHYVISVKGLPASLLKRDGALSPGASLSAANLQPKAVEFVALADDRLTLLLAFPMFDPPITASDKTLVFTMNLMGLKIAAKFEPKKMVCRGRLNL